MTLIALHRAASTVAIALALGACAPSPAPSESAATAPAAATTEAAAPAPANAPTDANGPDAAAVFARLAKPVAGFELTSPDIADGQTIAQKHVFNGFGCSGQNVSPVLRWQGAPAGTKSFAVVVYDPDAPTGSGWWHWVIFNIPANFSSLAAGAGDPNRSGLPAGSTHAITDFGSPGYGGPCPPPGDKPHRYFFRVHALGVEKIDMQTTASPALVGFNINANTLATAQLVALYGR
jgi:Raf kinase inhibitor-like YbhB/YbcL family protein